MTPLSNYNHILKLFLPIFIFFMLIILVSVFTIQLSNFIRVSIFLLIISIFYYVAKIVYEKTENIFYDSQKVYLISKKGKREILYKNLNNLKQDLSIIKLFSVAFTQHKIIFNNKNSEIETVCFYVHQSENNLEHFKNKILKSKIEKQINSKL